MGLLAIWALIGGVGDGEERAEHGSLPFVPPAFKAPFLWDQLQFASLFLISSVQLHRGKFVFRQSL